MAARSPCDAHLFDQRPDPNRQHTAEEGHPGMSKLRTTGSTSQTEFKFMMVSGRQAACDATRYRRHAWSLSRPPFLPSRQFNVSAVPSSTAASGSTRREADRDRRRDATGNPVGARNRTHKGSLHRFSLGRVRRKADDPGWRWHLAVGSQSVVDDQPRYGFVGCNLPRQNQGSPAVQRGCDMWGRPRPLDLPDRHAMIAINGVFSADVPTLEQRHIKVPLCFQEPSRRIGSPHD